MTAWAVWALFALFIAKHYVADFPLQRNPYTWQHKHIYWHPGGWLHALIHGVMTFWLLGVWALGFSVVVATPTVALLLAVADMLIHHHIDWWKMNKNRREGWKPDTSPEFWVLLGQDQLAHYATYAAIVAVILFLA